MAVKPNTTMLRSSVIALAIAALTLPMAAQAAPERGRSWSDGRSSRSESNSSANKRRSRPSAAIPRRRRLQPSPLHRRRPANPARTAATAAVTTPAPKVHAAKERVTKVVAMRAHAMRALAPGTDRLRLQPPLPPRSRPGRRLAATGVAVQSGRNALSAAAAIIATVPAPKGARGPTVIVPKAAPNSAMKPPGVSATGTVTGATTTPAVSAAGPGPMRPAAAMVIAAATTTVIATSGVNATAGATMAATVIIGATAAGRATGMDRATATGPAGTTTGVGPGAAATTAGTMIGAATIAMTGSRTAATIPAISRLVRTMPLIAAIRTSG
jgi:hypothetical protein